MLNPWQSVLVGLVFGAANFWLLARIVRGLTHAGSIKGWKIGAYFVVKMSLIFVIIGLLLKNSHVTPLPFLGGFTVSLTGGILGKILFQSSDKNAEKDNVPL